jgi:hypothetical protein
MTRNQALAIATAQFNQMNLAHINHDFKGGPAVNEASFGYRHGWVSVEGFSFGTDEMVGPNNQPYMD